MTSPTSPTSPTPPAAPESAKLPFKLLAAFGVGQVAWGVMGTSLSVFLVFYYNQVLGLSGSLAGTAVGLAVIVDAISDPVMGSLSDHWRSRFGRRHPFMYVSILPLAISFYLLFNPWVTSDLGLFIWLAVFANLTRTAMSLYNIPHMALGAEITEDYDQRSALVAHRYFFERVGILLTIAVGFGFFFASTPSFPNGQFNAAAYSHFALFGSILMAVTIFWAAWGTRSVIPNLPKLPDSPKIGIVQTLQRVVSDLISSLRSRSFRWLFGGMMNVYAVAGANGALDLYMYSYFWEIGTTGAMLVYLGYPIGGIVGAFFGPALYARFGKRAGLIFGVLGWAIFQTTPVAMRLLGLFPENGDALLLPLLVGMKTLSGATVIQADIAFGSMVADIVDEHELATEKRQEGIFFAATFFAGKATAGVGAMVAGFALDLISWPRGAHIQTAADIPPATILELGIVYGPVFAVFGFASAWCFTHYRLTRERHTEILAELAERRRSVAAGSP